MASRRLRSRAHVWNAATKTTGVKITPIFERLKMKRWVLEGNKRWKERFLFPSEVLGPSLLPRVHTHIRHICAAHVSQLKSNDGLAGPLGLFGELLFNVHVVCLCARAGDTIASVNESLVEGCQHKEIVQLIRAGGNTVRWGDAAAAAAAAASLLQQQQPRCSATVCFKRLSLVPKVCLFFGS